MKESPAILVVDDDAMVLRVVTTALRRAYDDVATAKSGEEALELLSSRTFCVLVTDWMMPGINGLELSRRARALHPDIGIVVMSGNVSDEDEQTVEALGAVLLRKPFDAKALIATVRDAAD